MSLRYSVIIEWSDEDQAYVVSLPEWGPFAHTHGRTYQEALDNALEVLQMLVEGREENGEPLPPPHYFDATERIDKPARALPAAR